MRALCGTEGAWGQRLRTPSAWVTEPVGEEPGAIWSSPGSRSSGEGLSPQAEVVREAPCPRPVSTAAPPYTRGVFPDSSFCPVIYGRGSAWPQ